VGHLASLRRPHHAQEVVAAAAAAALSTAVAVRVGRVVRNRYALLTLRRRRVSNLPGLVGVRSLKALHSGVVGDYVAWLVFGVALVGALFAFLLR
jgi:hypothetical protein